jgi:hypothetical protein
MSGDERQRFIIEGVGRYKVLEPLFECVRVTLSYHGVEYSPEYIQGISGAAFRIAGICPCAPTCSFAMSTHELPELLGFETKHVTLESCGADWDKLVALAEKSKEGRLPAETELSDPDLKTVRLALIDLLSQVKEEIRSGRPAVLWNAFTIAEYDVVTGFDESTGELLGFGSYGAKSTEYAKAPQFNMMTAAHVGGWPAAVLIGVKKTDVDRRAVEISALKEAVLHAHSDKNADKLEQEEWVLLEGLRCYDRWIADWSKPDKIRDAGDAYCYGIYRETHRAASGFLREIAQHHPSATTDLQQAADSFKAEADALMGGETLLWWDSPEGPDADRNQRVKEILEEARHHYASGIKNIENALATMKLI